METRILNKIGGRRAAFSLLLILTLALRLVGPLPGPPAREGYVGLCVGTEILYVPLASLDEPGREGRKASPESVPCPWFGQFHVLLVAALPVAFSLIALTAAFPIAWGGTTVLRPAPHPFQARAPPIGPGFR